jgi:glycosyltransferase involved in cell wall biosynthesis
MKKTIGMILDVDRPFPPDIRVEKEAKALINAGFEVSLLAKRVNVTQPLRERLDYGLEVFRVNIAKQRPFQTVLNKITLFNRDWFESITDFIHLSQPDVLHAHDLYIVPTALGVAKMFNMPLVADLHENIPAAHVAYRANLNIACKLASRVLENYYLWRWHERCALRQCTRIIAVVPEATERLINNYRIPPDKICIVSNTEDESTFDVSSIDHEIVDHYQDNWTALYMGGIGPHRGIDTAIRSAAQVGCTIPNFKLVVVGVQRDEDRKRMIKLAREADASQYLELVNWVPSHKVNSYIAASDVCIVPHNNFEHTNTTVPHKLFQYMIMKKPVVVSSCRPLKRIVEDTQSGLVFKANDPHQLSHCIESLYKGGDECIKKYGNNGLRAALGHYSWKNDSERLVNMYNNLFDLK